MRKWPCQKTCAAAPSALSAAQSPCRQGVQERRAPLPSLSTTPNRRHRHDQAAMAWLPPATNQLGNCRSLRPEREGVRPVAIQNLHLGVLMVRSQKVEDMLLVRFFRSDSKLQSKPGQAEDTITCPLSVTSLDFIGSRNPNN